MQVMCTHAPVKFCNNGGYTDLMHTEVSLLLGLAGGNLAIDAFQISARNQGRKSIL
jgi:hypothetical protein